MSGETIGDYEVSEVSASIRDSETDDKLFEVVDGENRYYFWKRFEGTDSSIEFTYAEIPGVKNVSQTQLEDKILAFVSEELL